MTAADLDAWIPQLTGLRAAKRAKLQGVSHSRSRQILAGAVVARAAMKALNVDSVDVCPWALREGIVLHYLQSTHTGSFDLPLRPLAGTAYQANPAVSGEPRVSGERGSQAGQRQVAVVAPRARHVVTRAVGRCTVPLRAHAKTKEDRHG